MNDSRIIDIFLNVIRIDARSGNEKPLADFIKKFIADLDYRLVEDKSKSKSGSNSGNLICKYGSGGDFVMLSHMDTARSTKEVKPAISGNKIKSDENTVLGVDNRAGVAVLLFILEKIFTEKIPARDFTVAFTTCEETTLAGSKNLNLSKKIKMGFVFDSSHRPGNFINSACGSMGFKIIVNGKASHSGIAPEKGINSIEAVAKAISKIKQGRLDNETTINIGKISGGSAVNVVPEQTIIEGEVRSFNALKVEKIIKRIRDVFKIESRKISAGLKFNSEWDFKPYSISKDKGVYIETISTLKKAGLKPTPRISLGGSDANSLNARNIPSVNLGIGAQNPHSNEEFIFIEDLYKSAEIALELIKQN